MSNPSYSFSGLSADDATLILDLLAKQPWETVAVLLNKLREQAFIQSNAYQASLQEQQNQEAAVKPLQPMTLPVKRKKKAFRK